MSMTALKGSDPAVGGTSRNKKDRRWAVFPRG